MIESWRRGDLAYQLKPTQRELHDWMTAQDQMVSVIHARRGYGKSWLFLTDAFETCIQLGNRGEVARLIYAAPTREDAADGVPQHMLPKWYASDHAFIFPKTGARCIVEGADDDHGDHLRGPFAHKAYCDEAGFWRHLLYCLNSVLIPIVKRRAGKIYVASTSPKSVGHDFISVMARAINRDAYVKRTIDDDHTLTKGEIDSYALEYGQTVEEGRKSTEFRREYLCELVTDANRAVIPEFSEARHVVTEYERPVWVDCYEGLDLGLVDLTHLLFGFWDFANARLVIEDEICGNYMLTKDFAELAKAKEKELWGAIEYYDKPTPHNRCPRGRYSDNEAQTLYDLAGYGMSFAPAIKVEKEAALNRLRQLFASGKVQIHARCVNLIHQLKVGMWNERRTDYERLPGAGHLDGVDALLYMARSIDRNRNPVPPMLGVSHTTHFVPAASRRTNNELQKLVRR